MPAIDQNNPDLFFDHSQAEYYRAAIGTGDELLSVNLESPVSE